MTSTSNETSIPTLPPPTIHLFFNARNLTAIQENFYLTYAGHKIHLPSSFCPTLLQEHILAIPDPDAPTELSPLLTPPPSYVGTSNAQQWEIWIQVLLAMGQEARAPVKGRGGITTGPEVPRGYNFTGVDTQHKELREPCRGIPGIR